MGSQKILQAAFCLLLAVISCETLTCSAQTAWLSLCGQCLNPSVTSKSGIGTADSIAEARITRRDAVAWCSNWHPEDADCVTGQLPSDGAKKTYRATANCVAGQITAIDGKHYSLSGVWTSDVEKGRARFRDSNGAVVGQDEASGGLAIAQQWEILCPARPGKARTGATRETPRLVLPVPTPALSAATAMHRSPSPHLQFASLSAQNPRAEVNPCHAKPRCYNGGVFTAEVTQLIAAAQPRQRIVRMNVVFHNFGAEPLILGYVAKSSSIIDNQGNPYYPAAGGAVDTSVAGMGMVSAGKADTSFSLGPGESRNASFQLFRKADRTVIGTSFSWTVKIAQLSILANGKQVSTEHEYSVNIPDMTVR